VSYCRPWALANVAVDQPLSPARSQRSKSGGRLPCEAAIRATVTTAGELGEGVSHVERLAPKMRFSQKFPTGEAGWEMTIFGRLMSDGPATIVS